MRTGSYACGIATPEGSSRFASLQVREAHGGRRRWWVTSSQSTRSRGCPTTTSSWRPRQMISPSGCGGRGCCRTTWNELVPPPPPPRRISPSLLPPPSARLLLPAPSSWLPQVVRVRLPRNLGELLLGHGIEHGELRERMPEGLPAVTRKLRVGSGSSEDSRVGPHHGSLGHGRDRSRHARVAMHSLSWTRLLVPHPSSSCLRIR